MSDATAVDAPRATRREWIGLLVIALPCMLYSMDLTVLNLALPQLSADLKPTSAELLWIVDIYGFLVAGSLITMGTLGDRIGRRRLLLIGATAFGIGSVLAAFSTSPRMLIATRALLGIAGATLAPSTLSLIRSMFHDPGQRTFAIGVWVTNYSVGGAIGPLLGGILLQYFWWGSVFLIGVPVMLLLLVVGPVLLPEFRDPEAGLWMVPSMLAFTAGSFLVPRIVRRVPAARVMSAGMVLAAVGFGLLTRMDGRGDLAVLVTGLVIYSLGLSPVVILATDLIVGSAPVERAGAASAISETSSELGGALGIAVLGSVATAVYRFHVTGAMPAGVPREAADAALATLGGAVAVAQRLPHDVGAELLEVVRAAFTRAFETTAAINGALSIATAILAAVLLRRSASRA
jgi:MFS family permease